jgi:hypothetical protein
MKTFLRIGVAVAFVLVAIGDPIEGLAIVGALALADRLERRP